MERVRNLTKIRLMHATSSDEEESSGDDEGEIG
jgi:hypothetical protein